MGACAGRHRTRLEPKGRRSNVSSLLCCLRTNKKPNSARDKMVTKQSPIPGDYAGNYRCLREQARSDNALTNGSAKHSLHGEEQLLEHAEEDDESGFYEADNKIPKLRMHKPLFDNPPDISFKTDHSSPLCSANVNAESFSFNRSPPMKSERNFCRLKVDMSKRKPIIPEGELLAWIGKSNAVKLNDIRELLRNGQDADESAKFVILSQLTLDPTKSIVKHQANQGSFNLICTNQITASLISDRFRQYLIAKYAAEVVDCLLDQKWVRKGNTRHLATVKFFRDGKFILPSLLAIMPLAVESHRTLQLFNVTRSNDATVVESATTLLVLPLQGWPQGFCAEYFKRSRLWPSKEVLEIISQSCAALEPGDKDEWRFFFGLAESAIVEALSDTQKSLLRRAMALYLCQAIDNRALCINRGSLFPASLLSHAFLRFLEITNEADLNLSAFADYLHHNLQRCSLRHYFDSSINLRNYADIEQWQESKERLSNLYRHHRPETVCQRPFGEQNLRLRYIISFHEIIAEQISDGQLRRIDPAVIERINASLQNEGNLLACSLEINEDLFYKSIEQCANIVQSYIKQIRVDSIPILYHCLWSSYIHYAFPFISEIFRRPLF